MSRGWTVWEVGCGSCYDGSPDSPNRYLYGTGPTEAEAILDWNEKAEDWE